MDADTQVKIKNALLERFQVDPVSLIKKICQLRGNVTLIAPERYQLWLEEFGQVSDFGLSSIENPGSESVNAVNEVRELLAFKSASTFSREVILIPLYFYKLH